METHSPSVGDLLHRKCPKGGKKKYGRITRGKNKGCFRTRRKAKK